MFSEHFEGDVPDVGEFVGELVALQKSVTGAAGRNFAAFNHLLQKLEKECSSLQVTLTTGRLRERGEERGSK